MQGGPSFWLFAIDLDGRIRTFEAAYRRHEGWTGRDVEAALLSTVHWMLRQRQDAHLLRLHPTKVVEDVWRGFLYDHETPAAHLRNCHVDTVKLLYVIMADDAVLVAHPGRLVHSQMARGSGVRCAGELIFSAALDELVEVTNGSGHYQPSAALLPFARALIIAQLPEGVGVSATLKLTDVVAQNRSSSSSS